MSASNMSTPSQPEGTGQLRAGPGPAKWLVPVMLVAATVAVYGRTTGFQFVFDDTSFILTNPLVQSPSNIPRYFTQPVWSGIAIAQQNYYRPLFLLWVLANYSAFDGHPAWWHLAALLLHCLNALLVYLAALRLVKETLAAGAGAALFALHPVQAESVSWICCSNDLLACFFVLASFLAYGKAREAGGGRSLIWWSVSLACYAAGALSKEPAVLLPLLMLLHEWSGRPAVSPLPEAPPVSRLRAYFPFASYFAVAAAYFLLRRNALGSFLGTTVEVIGRREELLTQPSLLASYLAHFLWPASLSPLYDVSYQRNFNFAGVLLPALLLLIPAGLLAWAAWRSPGARFSIAWVLLFLVPALHIAVFPRSEVVHDRFLYLPMAGAGLLAAIGFAAAVSPDRRVFGLTSRGQHTLSWAAGVLLGALALISWHQAGYWSNNYELFRRGVEIAPNNGIAAGNLGIEYMKVGDRATAAVLLRRADALNPDIWEAEKKQAYEHLVAGRYKEAEQALDAALVTRPDDGLCHFLLGLVYLKTGRPEQAVAEARRGVALSPREPGLHYGLATILEATGDLAGAREEYRAELAVRPGHQPSLDKSRELDQRLAATPRR